MRSTHLLLTQKTETYGTSPKNGHTADQEASFPHRAVRDPPACGANDCAAFVPP